jgi:hypothetical protein
MDIEHGLVNRWWRLRKINQHSSQQAAAEDKPENGRKKRILRLRIPSMQRQFELGTGNSLEH